MSKKWTKEEENKLTSLYGKGFTKGDGQLDFLVRETGRTKQLLCRKAGLLGLTNMCRIHSQKWNDIKSKKAKEYIKKYGHPRGYLGHKHSDETRKKLSEASIRGRDNRSEKREAERVLKMLKTKEKKGILYKQRTKTTWKSGWRKIGGARKYYRSRWEANYARYLQWLKDNNQIKEWEHEPETFWFEDVSEGCRGYLPDFKVVRDEGCVAYHEVKGWMDDRSKLKLKRMAEYYPDIKLIIIDSTAYKDIKKDISKQIDGWE